MPQTASEIRAWLDNPTNRPMLVSITSADFSAQGLKRLSPEIGKFTGLRKLDLSHNHLEDLPSEIGELCF